MSDAIALANEATPAPPAVAPSSVLSGTATFPILVGFLVLLLLTGGGSRADIESLVVLRPLSFLIVAYAALAIDWRSLAEVRVPFTLLTLLALLVGLHLVPLPPAVWLKLPDHRIIADIYHASGIDLPWLPLTPVPGRGLNTFMSLATPFAVLMLFASLSIGKRRDLYVVVWIGALASVFLGIAQLAGSPNGPLYLYRITNSGLPVGFLANRNHQGLLVAVGILLSGYLAATAIARRKRSATLTLTGSCGAILMFLLFLMVLGSRAGLLLGAAMLFPVAFMIFRALQARRSPGGGSIWQDRRVRWGMIAAAAAVTLIFVSAYLFSRSLAFDRLVDKEFDQDVRSAVLPVMVDLIKRFGAIGSGFGSFEALFKQAEPFAMLSPSYMNHAHNDWLEFTMEAGIPGLVILAAFVLWYLRAAIAILRARVSQFDFEGFVAITIIFAFGAASVVDYPLRVPVMMALFSIACGHVAARRQTM